jgi:hypothetical protein
MREDPKLRGEWVESLFLARANELGLAVSKPWGDSHRYDFVVEAGSSRRDGKPRLRRVQVKSTSRRFNWGYHCHIDSRTGKHTRAYTSAQVDFFAIYIVPERRWYILPIEVLARCRDHIYLNPHCNSKYSRYLEAWHLLGRPLRIPQIHACVDQSCSDLGV